MASGLEREFRYRAISIEDVLRGAIVDNVDVIDGANSGFAALEQVTCRRAPLRDTFYIEIIEPHRPDRRTIGPYQESDLVLARYISPEAVTLMGAPNGDLEWRPKEPRDDDDLRVMDLYRGGVQVSPKQHIITVSTAFEDFTSGYRELEPWMDARILGTEQLKLDNSGRFV